MEEKNEKQDVDLENNEETTEEPTEESEEQSNEESSEESNEESEAEVEELRAEVAKLKRINDKLNKKQQEPQEPKEEPKESHKSGELDYGQKAYLKSYGVSGSDELALVKQFQARGFELDSIVEDDVFTAKLENLRQAKKTEAAIPKGKKRSGQTGTTELDMAVAKYNETGELPKNFKLRNKVIDKAISKKSNSAPFG